MARGGPKTDEGKAVIAQNAITHGVLSMVPVLPGIELPEAWESHRTGVLASLTPEGGIEQALVERIALLLWRLGRLCRYETELLAREQDTVVDSLAIERRQRYSGSQVQKMHPADLQGELAYADERREQYKRLPRWKPAQHVDGSDATYYLWPLARALGVECGALSFVGAPPSGDWDVWENWDGWTGAAVRAAIEAIAAAAELSVEDALQKARREALVEAAAAKYELEVVAQRISALRVMRYESHLQRQLVSTLHELEALQERRRGKAAPLLRVDVSQDGEFVS